MLRHRLLASAGALALTTLGLVHHANAATAWLPTGKTTPTEQRVAVAVGQTRTTIWTSLRLDAASGPVGLLIPVPAGAALDHSSDAWLEALDAATAPRIFPPTGSSHACPGESPDLWIPFHVTSDLAEIPSVKPIESTVLADAPAVFAWAATNGFGISPDVASALENMPGMRFFVERFVAPPAPFVTSTLRVVLPSQTPVLPLALTRAGASDLRVTAWFVGAGRASLTGASPVKLHLENLLWNASSQDSNYVDLRASELLGVGPAAVVTEASSHDALVKDVAIAGGTQAITGVVRGYFQRAKNHLDIDESIATDPCISNAAVSLESPLDVASSCPRADLGVVGGGPGCVEAPNGSQVDPDKLRCGAKADDLAIALSGLKPASTWLTRVTMMITKDTAGQTWPIAFTPAAPDVDPILTATSIDFSGCGASSSSGSSSGGSTSGGSTSGSPWSGSSSGGGSGNSTSGSYYEPSYEPDMACACAGAADPVIVDDTTYDDTTYYDDTSSDDCAGDTTDTAYDDTYYDDTSSDDCAGDTTDTTYDDTTYDDTTYDDTSSDDCDGDTSDSYYDDSSSSDEGIDCSGDTDDDTDDDSDDYDYSDDSSDSSECTVARRPQAKPHKRGPKASVVTLGLLAFLAPLRRWSRPRRTQRTREDNPSRIRSR
ncbi:MAG: DUF2330 domain-containing protein [Polyangiaceae bacterium]|nr:DUF2330 domain-containing protein [Polyangiaceae bacterium]